MRGTMGKLSKLNYLVAGDLFPKLGKALECKHGEKTIWYGKVIIGLGTGQFTGQCDTEQEADEAAKKLLEILRGEK
jgi:hypothetical protein